MIRICPPLIVSERDVDDAIRILDESFAVATGDARDAVTGVIRCARGEESRAAERRDTANAATPCTYDPVTHQLITPVHKRR